MPKDTKALLEKVINYKPQVNCNSCDHKKKTNKDGVCLIQNGSDGLPVMCTGNWILCKHYYLERYLDLFVRAMSKNWGGNINYIDLFAGPGKCRIRESGEETEGSPLIALKYNFARYIFVDVIKSNIEILAKRCESRIDLNKISFITGDCNKSIENIKQIIPEHSLNVALVDPFGLNFDFESYEKLTNVRKIDLIINFPIGMAIKRNYLKSDHEKLDRFLGGIDWKKGTINNPTKYFIDYFKGNLEKIGYQIPKEFDPYGEIVIKNLKEIPLYDLLFASKHPLGAIFWQKIKKFDPIGQPSLF